MQYQEYSLVPWQSQGLIGTSAVSAVVAGLKFPIGSKPRLLAAASRLMILRVQSKSDRLVAPEQQ